MLESAAICFSQHTGTSGMRQDSSTLAMAKALYEGK